MEIETRGEAWILSREGIDEMLRPAETPITPKEEACDHPAMEHVCERWYHCPDCGLDYEQEVDV